MKWLSGCAALAALALSADALALGAIAEVQIVDRDSGKFSAHYQSWRVLRQGGRAPNTFDPRCANPCGGRILAVTSVDGAVNVLSGATAGYDQEGYIFSASGL